MRTKIMAGMVLMVIAGILLGGCGQNGEITDLEGKSFVDIAPSIKTGNILGEVGDEGTALPIANATVSVLGISTVATTEIDGSYSLTNIPEGQQKIVVTKDGYTLTSTTVEVLANLTVRAPVTYLSASTGVGNITGYVRDLETNSIISNASITIENSTLEAAGNSSGKFTLENVPIGSQTLTINKSGYVANSVSVVVSKDKTINTSIIFLVASDSVDNISGSVKNLETNLAIAGATITLEGSTASAVTGSDGSFSIENIISGTKTLYFTKADYISESVAVNIQTGRTTNLNPVYLKAETIQQYGNISGSVKNIETNLSLRGATITVEGSTASAITESNGSFTLENIGTGTKTLYISNDGYIASTLTITVVAGKTITPSAILLTPASGVGTIVGYVKNSDYNTMVSSAVITLEGSSVTAITEANGYFTLTNAPVGTYTIYASKPYHRTGSATVTVLESKTTNANMIAMRNLYQFAAKWGSYGTESGQFKTGYYSLGMAADKNGSTYVADTDNSRIEKFDGEGNFLLGIGNGITWTDSAPTPQSDSDHGFFSSPRGVAVDDDNNIYVTDTANNRVQKFDANGNFLLGIGGGRTWTATESVSAQSGNQNGYFNFNSWSQVTISIDNGRNIYVADNNNYRIQKFDSSGNFILGIGNGTTWTGNAPTPKSGPTNNYFSGTFVIAEKNGYLYAYDSNNYSFQKFDADGNFVSRTDLTLGFEEGELAGSYTQIALDSNNNIFIGSGLNNINVYTEEGNYLGRFRITANENGRLIRPSGLVINNHDDVYVSDSLDGIIYKFTREY